MRAGAEMNGIPVEADQLGEAQACLGREQQLPVLSTYLGHTCVRDTYWYLSACPELMEEAARRLDRRWEAKP